MQKYEVEFNNKKLNRYSPAGTKEQRCKQPKNECAYPPAAIPLLAAGLLVCKVVGAYPKCFLNARKNVTDFQTLFQDTLQLVFALIHAEEHKEVCPGCDKEGHDANASYCKFCGEKL